VRLVITIYDLLLASILGVCGILASVAYPFCYKGHRSMLIRLAQAISSGPPRSRSVESTGPSPTILTATPRRSRATRPSLSPPRPPAAARGGRRASSDWCHGRKRPVAVLVRRCCGQSRGCSVTATHRRRRRRERRGL
jgi:hypothetical protein